MPAGVTKTGGPSDQLDVPQWSSVEGHVYCGHVYCAGPTAVFWLGHSVHVGTVFGATESTGESVRRGVVAGMRRRWHGGRDCVAGVASARPVVSGEGADVLQVEQAQVQLAASEQQQRLQVQEAALRSMLGQLQALKTAQVT